ncbi:MAG: ribulose-phosphate 3-epimerase [Blastocatellia bacterium AA13]|nr:MAG: ribulose-phosphate 3-epimerase [Blastocatellia bacterium AA13]
MIMDVQIAPSILSADFTRLGEELRAAERGGAGLIHIDVMDGHFVPNISIGPMIVKAARRVTQLPLDCHLMISDPDRYIEEFAHAGASMISVHVEAVTHLNRTLTAIRGLGCKPGVVLNPATPLVMVEEALGFVDYVLIMSVNPGFGGQSFIDGSLDKVGRLRDMIARSGFNVHIEVDGGLGLENVAAVVRRGAEWIVAGTAVFGTGDPEKATRELRLRALEPLTV